jgi:hypothetical protein
MTLSFDWAIDEQDYFIIMLTKCLSAKRLGNPNKFADLLRLSVC